ncbi:MAG: site-2 protease family protein [Buchananella hordeovulneris]|nr:site-2 protease family protein [Buchananella hordeovulneris]
MYLLGILLLILGLLFSVALHEIGHLLPAKLFGVKVPQYFVGFGKTLFSKRIGETEYGVKAIPLGGFVRLVGMYPPERTPDKPARDGSESMVAAARREALEEIAPGEENRAFYNLSVPKKIVVMFGGPFMNLLLATVLIIIVFVGIGMPTLDTGRISQVMPCVPASYLSAASPAPGAAAPGCDGGVAGPAAVAGMQVGDTIQEWNGQAVTDWASVQAAIAASPAGQELPVVVRRGESEVTLHIAPVWVSIEGTERAFVGISPSPSYVPQSLGSALRATGEATVATGKMIVRLPAMLANAAGATLGLTEREPGGLMGLVGIGRMAGEVTSAEGVAATPAVRAAGFLSLLASLNLSLFIFNLLPILPLDGGHITGALWEGLRKGFRRLTGRGYAGPTDTAKMLPFTYATIYFLIGLTLLLVVADVVAPAV